MDNEISNVHNNLINKKNAWVLLCMAIFLVIGGYLVGNASNKVNKNTETIQPISNNSTESNTVLDLPKKSLPVSNPDRDLYLWFNVRESESKHRLSVNLNGFRPLRITVDDMETSEVLGTELEFNENLFIKYLNYPTNFGSVNMIV